MYFVKYYLRIEFYVLFGYLVNKYVGIKILWFSILLFFDIIVLVEGNKKILCNYYLVLIRCM